MRFLLICALALFPFADISFAANIGSVATNVTNDLSGLGKALTIPADARGAAMEVKGVVELKRQHDTETSMESRPRHFGPGHRAH
jgi:hypothetical protein